MTDALSCIVSLIKISNKFDHILESSGQNTTQKQLKMIVLATIKLVQNFLKI